MTSFRIQDNPDHARIVRCMNETCKKNFVITEDIRQKYCSRTCSAIQKRRRLEERAFSMAHEATENRVFHSLSCGFGDATVDIREKIQSRTDYDLTIWTEMANKPHDTTMVNYYEFYVNWNFLRNLLNVEVARRKNYGFYDPHPKTNAYLELLAFEDIEWWIGHLDDTNPNVVKIQGERVQTARFREGLERRRAKLNSLQQWLEPMNLPAIDWWISDIRNVENHTVDIHGHQFKPVEVHTALLARRDELEKIQSSKPKPRLFAEFRDEGLLWLINTSVFHPRGYALALHYSDDQCRTVDGWLLLGDGKEPWAMLTNPPTDEERAKFGAQSLDELFAKVNALMPIPAQTNP